MRKIYKCIICGTEHVDIYCPNCGARADIGVKEMRYCPKCGTQCMDKLCPVCGTATVAKVDANMKSCKRCGTMHNSSACPNCGYIEDSYEEPIERVEGEVIMDGRYANYGRGQQRREIIQSRPRGYMVRYQPRNKAASMLMCLFGGWFGLHKFYEGKIGTGILYAMTGGLFGIGIIVDLVRMITNTYTDANGNLLE